ncbi:hypothetical protein [Marinitoga lauensis]|uniref:hypothetical protein n=1 Tax=Marinitoga lauensis TaxID=2201189 RepID=UPI001404EEF0|nr:hypothetical protein [Marinitoga lauensis]
MAKKRRKRKSNKGSNALKKIVREAKKIYKHSAISWKNAIKKASKKYKSGRI